MEPWVLIPVAAIVMWGIQGIVRAFRGLPEPRRVHRRRGGGLVVGKLATADDASDPRSNESLRAELEDVRQRLGELEALHQRVVELEERQDFTERVLTRGSRDPEQGGSHAS